MNWGWKIAIVYIVFVVMVIGMVTITSMKSVNLVEQDYYEKEIKYQEHIEKLKNTTALDDKFTAYFDNELKQLKIQLSGFAGESINGEVLFFRPSDNSLDRKQVLELNEEGVQVINLNGLKKGFWVAKLSWSINDVEYFKRINIDIQ